MRTQLLFCLFFIVASVVANCVDNCNSHGSCRNGECVCNDGWGGDDCSIWDKEIESGETLSGHLQTFQWKYYHVDLPNGANGLHIDVIQTSSFGDIDLFVGKDTYPDSSNFIESDTFTGTHLVIDIAPATAGTWYIGIYGYWSADYDITVDIQYACTVDCGQFGYCDGSVCACYEPWEGEDCSTYNENLDSGVPVYNEVETGEWKYFNIYAEEGGTLHLTMTQAEENLFEDLDVYIALNRFPAARDFDYLNATTINPTEMHLSSLTEGNYEIGVYGYRGGDFSLEVSVFADDTSSCANDCSLHGSCSGGVCSCEDGYSGNYCQTYASMALDSSYDGYVSSGNWNYWYINYFSESPLRISVTQIGQGDCDLYIKQNSDPTRVVYQFADMSLNEEYSIVIQNPGNEIWHIGVYGWTTCSYEIIAESVETCECTAGSHGHCQEGTSQCVCEIGYAGDTCIIPTLAISSSQVLSLQFVQPHSWNYYHFTSDSSAVSITMVETSTEGELFLAASLSGYPSGENFDYYDISNSDFHEIHIVWHTERVSRTYFIGVLTSSSSVATDPIQYSITAYGTPF